MAYRIDKLYKLLEEKSLDAIIVSTPQNIRYYLGIETVADTVILLHLTRDTIEVYTPVLEYYRVRDYINRDIEVKAFTKKLTSRPEDMVVVEKGLSSLVEDLGSRYEKIGCDYKSSPIGILLKEKLGDKVVDIEEDISRHRMFKDDRELEAIKRAVEATIKGIKTLVDSIHDKATETELAGIFEYRARIEGYEEQAFPPLVLFKPSNSYPHKLPGKNVLKNRDLVLVDVGVKVDGYCSDLTRTIPWGRLYREERKVLEAVNEAIENAIDKFQPGMKASELDAIARETLAKHGYDKYFIHGLGHGIGIDVHEKPYLNPVSDTRLEPGMVFTIEPGVYFSGRFGVRIEEDVVVTKKGLRILSRSLPRILYP